MALKKGQHKDDKSRNFCISWNNYPTTLTLEVLRDKLIKLANVEYLILGYEKGEKKETPHIQGYVRFTNAIKLGSVERLLKNDNGTYGYLELALGNDNQNQEYCSKQNNFIEYGKPRNQHEIKENYDISNLIDDIIEGMDFTELCKKYHKYILYHYRDFKELFTDIKQANKHKKDIDSINIDDLPF